MEKLKEYFKLFTYVFYPAIIFIFYLAQIIEGNMKMRLFICPIDFVVIAIVLFLYMLYDYFKVYDYKVFKMMKNEQGKIKIPYLLLSIFVLVPLMGLYDDLKVYFYLNNEVSVSLLILGAIWAVLIGVCYLINKKES